MDEMTQAAIRSRCTALAGLAATLQADLLLCGVYEDMARQYGGYESETEGAQQAACAAMAKIEEHLAVLKGYCS